MVGKLQLMGPGPNYSSTRVLLYTKMLKETENEETRLFCPIFIISGISIGRGAKGRSPLPIEIPLMIINAILTKYH